MCHFPFHLLYDLCVRACYDLVWITNWVSWTLCELITAGDYNSFMDLHTLQITVLQHTKSSVSSPVIAW
jgi:hypothetical protein